MVIFVVLVSILAVVCQAGNVPSQTQNPIRPLRMEIGVFVADDLYNDFVESYRVNRAYARELFRAILVSNYLMGLNSTFSDSSIGGLNLQVIITHFKVVPRSTWSQWSGISSFCQWQATMHELQLDAAILLVRSGGDSAKQVRLTGSAGRSFTDTLGSDLHCGMINEEPSLSTAYKRLISHELGHIIGLTDQGQRLQWKLRNPTFKEMADNHIYPYNDMRCSSSDQKGVMAGNSDIWSICSRDRLRLIMGSDKSKVLEDFRYPGILPAEWFTSLNSKMIPLSREDLCRAFVSKNDPKGTTISYKQQSNPSECKFGMGECQKTVPFPGNMIGRRVYDGVPFLTGFGCSSGFCFFGECLTGKQILDKAMIITRPNVH